jgi:ubiquinone/menaquinone biosynthesis C-methylase UbiE
MIRDHRFKRKPPRPLSREGEIAVYRAAYESPNYGMGARRQASVESILVGLAPLGGSLLDVSTGRSETLELAESAGFKPVMGTEVVDSLLQEGRVVYAEAHNLPFEDGQFDHVTCFDVLEHLLPDDVELAVRELRRVARKTVTVSASERSSVIDGLELHISRRPAAEWEALIRRCWGGAMRIQDAGGTPCWQWRLR